MQKKAVNMVELSANSLISGLQKHAELLGAAYGAINNWGVMALVDNIGRVTAGAVHFPNVDSMLNAIVDNKENKMTVTLAAVAYFGGDLVGGSTGAAIKKFGKGVAEGFAAQHVLYWSTHSDEGCTQPGHSRQSNRGGSSGTLPQITAGYGY